MSQYCRRFGKFGLTSPFRLAALLVATAALATPTLANIVTGTVLDATGTRPLQGAEVRIAALGRVAQVDSEGRFRFTDLPAGSYSVAVSFAGAGDQSRDVTVVDGSTSNISFALSPEGTEESMILVMGQQSTLLSSISRQRAADTVVTVLTRDSIGQFPDQNVAESLRRAPGINVLNDQGEGRFVSVRGLSPNLNSASINGNRVLATGGDERTVALDVIPNELIESIEIKKSLTPDMDGDTIGGSLDIKTTSAFDRKTGFLGLNAQADYNQLADKWSPKLSGNFSLPLTDNFGIAGGASWNRRRFSTDNIEMDGYQTADDGTVYAEDIEYRDYDVQRVRWGGNISLDWRPTPGTTLYLRGLYSKFDDTELRRRLVFGFDGAPSSAAGSAVTFLSGDGEIGVERDLKDRRETQTVGTVSVGGRTEAGAWTFVYDAAWSYADQQERNSVDPVVFAQGFEDPGALGVTIDYGDLRRPTYSIGAGSAAFLDPSGYAFDVLENTTREDAKDKEWAFRADVSRIFALDDGEFELKFGGKARLRDKRQNFVIDIYDGFDGDFTLADVLGRQDYTLANIEPQADLGLFRRFLGSNGYAAFERNAFDSDFATSAESYRAEENIYAGYVMGRLDSGIFRVIAGARVEHTQQTLFGSRVDVVDEALAVSPARFDRSYTDVLPSLNVRANIADKVVARFGAFRSLSRPGFGQLAPRYILEDGEGAFGNPALNPYKAWNLDGTLEYYFASASVIQGGLFWKSITDFIVDAEFEDGEFNGIPYDVATIPINGDKAEVFGAEVAYSQAFTMLPAPFDGLLTNINYTYTNARGDVLGRRIPLPASSKHTFNVILGYEKGPISFRAAGSYRDQFLDELGSDADDDRYAKSLFQVDLSAKYRISPAFQVFVEVVNLNNATFTAFRRGPGQDRLLQFEEYRRTFKGGVRANF